MNLPAFTMPDDDQAETPADPFAPVTFRPRGLGSIVVCLGPAEIGELQEDDQIAGNYRYRISGCDGVASGWRRWTPLDDAKARVVEIVRDWIDATGIPAWIIARYIERCGGDHKQHQKKGNG